MWFLHRLKVDLRDLLFEVRAGQATCNTLTFSFFFHKKHVLCGVTKFVFSVWKNPTNVVSACPSGDNLLEWIGTIRGGEGTVWIMFDQCFWSSSSGIQTTSPKLFPARFEGTFLEYAWNSRKGNGQKCSGCCSDFKLQKSVEEQRFMSDFPSIKWFTKNFFRESVFCDMHYSFFSFQVYDGREYKLALEFPSTYPQKPPVVKFKTPCYHPNVDQQGNICLDILKVLNRPHLIY